MFESVGQDVRHGARMLSKTPGFTLIAVLSIAIGVGANAAMFSVADGLIFRPLDVPDPAGLIVVGTTRPDAIVRYGGISYPDYEDLRERVRSFDGLAATRIVLASLTRIATNRARHDRDGGERQFLRRCCASARSWDAASCRARTRATGSDRAVIVLAHDTWAERFGGEPGIVGSEIRVSGVPFTVVGVAPQGFIGTNHYLPAAYLRADGRPHRHQRADPERHSRAAR